MHDKRTAVLCQATQRPQNREALPTPWRSLPRFPSSWRVELSPSWSLSLSDPTDRATAWTTAGSRTGRACHPFVVISRRRGWGLAFPFPAAPTPIPAVSRGLLGCVQLRWPGEAPPHCTLGQEETVGSPSRGWGSWPFALTVWKLPSLPCMWRVLCEPPGLSLGLPTLKESCPYWSEHLLVMGGHMAQGWQHVA